MANTQHVQFSDENGDIYYLENQTEDVRDASGKPLSDGGDLSEASVTFTADSTRTLPKSGSRFKAFCGSVLKFLSDLQTVAFSGKYSDLSEKPSIPSGAAASQAVANNCTTTAAGSVLDARQGKVLMDKANQLSSELKGIGIVNDAITGTASIGDNELTNICNTWLEKGIYYINTHIRATLTNECNFDQYILVDDHQDARGSNSNVFGAGFNDNNIGFILEISATSSNVVLQVRHYSGERLSVDGWMFVTRIK